MKDNWRVAISFGRPVSDRTIDEKDRLLDYFLARGSLINEAKFSELKLPALAAELASCGRRLRGQHERL